MSKKKRSSETGWNVPDSLNGYLDMAARPRIRRRANWPENMHEPRPGYFTWRNPITKKTVVLGRMPVEQAIFEVLEANAVAKNVIPTRTLAERVAVGQETVADLIAKMPTEGLQPSTIIGRRWMDKQIRAAIGDVACANLSPRHVSDMIEAIKDSGHMQKAAAIRRRLSSICKKGCSLGWMETNPVTVTERVKTKVKRQRLTLETFNAILAKAPEVSEWLENAMLLALVSGQDRSTVARWPRMSVTDGLARVRRQKTGVVIDIPVALRLDVVGLSLSDVIARCKATGVVSKYLIHHVIEHGRAPRGSHIKLNSISAKFAQARDLAGFDGDGAPSFHEIRSLSKRLYVAQGNVDTKALLGHSDEVSARLYENNRGVEPVKVRIDAA